MAELTSLNPYLLRAFHEWALANECTPYISVVVEDDDDRVEVPREYVLDGQIVLNVSPEACGEVNLGNDEITLTARFSGEIRSIRVPVDRVSAIYVRETGFGIPFEVQERPKDKKSSVRRGFTKV